MGKSECFYYTHVFLSLDLNGASRLGVYWKLLAGQMGG